MTPTGITLTQFIIQSQRAHPAATGEFSGLLNVIATACKVIATAASRGALAGVLGSAEHENVQGEMQKKLDVMWKYVGPGGDVLGIDSFGASAPAEALFRRFGLTAEALAGKVREVLRRAGNR